MTLRALAPVLACLLLAGCEIPAQTYWSPDGTRAAYVAPSNPDSPAMVIDDKGSIVANLGQSIGGFAWSSDSKRLYFATMGCNPDAKAGFETIGAWLNAAEEEDDSPPDNDEKNGLTVSLWQDGKISTLFWIDRGYVSHMALSPDQNWLALVSATVKNKNNTPVLYVYSISAKRLYPVCVGTSRGFCFTGPHRLAYIQPHDVHKGKPGDIGQLVEVDLVDQADNLDRRPLLEVLLPVTMWLGTAGDDILFTSVAFAFPAPPPAEDEVCYSLFRYSREQKTAKPIVNDVFEYFSVSPDGRRVLLGAPVRAANDARPTQLSVLDLSNNAVRPLRTLASTGKLPQDTSFSGIPAYAAWRGNDHICCAAAVNPQELPVEQGNRLYFDLALHRLTDDHKLQPVRTLSKSWPLESKPSFRRGN